MSVTGRPVVKGYLARIRNGEIVSTMSFQFNPTEVTRSRTSEYLFSSPVGSPLPSAFFSNISGDTISFELLLDAVEEYSSDKSGVEAQKAFLESLTQPDIEDFQGDLGQFISPPQVRYGMGEMSFDVVVTSLQFRDVRWNRSLICTRSYAQLQLRNYFRDLESFRTYLNRLDTLRQLVTVTGGSSVGLLPNPF